MKNSTVLPTAALLALAFGLASCGGGGGDENAVSGDGGGASPAPAPAPAPSPSPAPAPPPSASGGAADCLNRKPWEQPTEFRYVLDDAGARLSAVITTTPGSMYEGQTATKFDVTFTSTGAADFQNSFFERLDGNTILRFGFQRLGQGANSPSTDQSFSPPLQDVRYTLSAGESQTSQTTSTTTTNGISIGAINYEVTYTYVGRESITVPAGSFETCRFRTVTPAQVPGAQSSTRDEWFAVGSGMIIQAQDDGAGTEVLVEASIDGVAITGN